MILIENIIFSIQKIGGISVVWSEHIKRLIKEKNLNVAFIEFPGAENNLLRRALQIPANKVIKGRSVLLRYRRFFNTKVRYQSPFVFHSSDYRVAKNRKAINIVTVHDLIYFRSVTSGLYEHFIKWIHCLQISHAIKRADYIICISRNTMNDLIKYIPNIDRNKISIVYNGAGDDYFPIKDKVSIDLPFKPYSYILFVGSRSRYKNFSLAVKSVAKTDFSLVIVGKKLDNKEMSFVKEYIKENRLVCLSDIDNTILNKLYNGAFCLLYPSSYEGFGIPVIEAQKAGCPVIANNKSSIPEIIGEAPLLIDELNESEIIKCIDLLKDENKRKQVIENGIINAKKYSWDNTYTQIKELYRMACDRLKN
jgi:mannosyltransferase